MNETCVGCPFARGNVGEPGDDSGVWWWPWAHVCSRVWVENLSLCSFFRGGIHLRASKRSDRVWTGVQLHCALRHAPLPCPLLVGVSFGPAVQSACASCIVCSCEPSRRSHTTAHRVVACPVHRGVTKLDKLTFSSLQRFQFALLIEAYIGQSSHGAECGM